jgi:hypothetical protein
VFQLDFETLSLKSFQIPIVSNHLNLFLCGLDGGQQIGHFLATAGAKPVDPTLTSMTKKRLRAAGTLIGSIHGDIKEEMDCDPAHQILIKQSQTNSRKPTSQTKY